MKEFTVKYQIDKLNHILSEIDELKTFAEHEKKYMAKRGKAKQAYNRIQFIKFKLINS